VGKLGCWGRVGSSGTRRGNLVTQILITLWYFQTHIKVQRSMFMRNDLRYYATLPLYFQSSFHCIFCHRSTVLSVILPLYCVSSFHMWLSIKLWYVQLTGESPPHLMPVPSQILDFQRDMSWYFLWSVSSVKVRHVSLILVVLMSVTI
jgi:hypothetical protein